MRQWHAGIWTALLLLTAAILAVYDLVPLQPLTNIVDSTSQPLHSFIIFSLHAFVYLPACMVAHLSRAYALCRSQDKKRMAKHGDLSCCCVERVSRSCCVACATVKQRYSLQ